MKNMLLLLLSAMIICFSCPAFSQDAPNAAPPTAPETAVTAPADPISPELNTLLDKIEKRSGELKSFEADMLFKQEQLLVDSVKIRNGKLYYQATPEAVLFRIHFADLLEMDLEEEEKPEPVKFNEDFAFDGRWLTRRNELFKSIQKYEISKEPANKETFRLGKGPFPLPFALTKADILKEFEVRLVPTDQKDPAKTSHLKLKPKKESSLAEKYLELDFWVSAEDMEPRQIRYASPDDEITTVTWSKIKTDKPISKKTFELEAPDKDWDVEVNPLEEAKP